MYRDRNYHGTTIGVMSATGQARRKQDFGPFVEGFVEFPHCACYRYPYNIHAISGITKYESYQYAVTDD